MFPRPNQVKRITSDEESPYNNFNLLLSQYREIAEKVIIEPWLENDLLGFRSIKSDYSTYAAKYPANCSTENYYYKHIRTIFTKIVSELQLAGWNSYYDEGNVFCRIVIWSPYEMPSNNARRKFFGIF